MMTKQEEERAMATFLRLDAMAREVNFMTGCFSSVLDGFMETREACNEYDPAELTGSAELQATFAADMHHLATFSERLSSVAEDCAETFHRLAVIANMFRETIGKAPAETEKH